ncbi:hypothetical protein BWQ96_08625 [Gracilariopsis chorda]|uniref:Uncharacterized protein n=1 Tax=Gracilariopsis chorda TaxID=448386 RepID=A0A2V3IHP3_9FLOR|nr:hypothetical protein BWQ96_08625 [Gracilariopsis chorda]|eukprot:PXF41614.1 hypothetical protein BWQ96_08625 [Gracilariopsis chorda]
MSEKVVHSRSKTATRRKPSSPPALRNEENCSKSSIARSHKRDSSRQQPPTSKMAQQKTRSSKTSNLRKSQSPPKTTQSPKLSPSASPNTNKTSKHVDTKPNSHTSSRTLKRAFTWKDPCNRSKTSPAPSKLEIAVSEQIVKWIGESLEKLIEVVQEKAFIGDIHVQRSRPRFDGLDRFGKHIDLGRKVVRHPQVTRFPCFFNVLQTVFGCLRTELDGLCDGYHSKRIQSLRLAAGHSRVVIFPRPSFGKKKGVCGHGPGCRDVHNVNVSTGDKPVADPTVYAELSRLRADLPNPTTYWTIIREASKFDLHPEIIGKYIVRTVLQHRQKGLLKRERVLGFANIMAPVREELQGLGEAAARKRDFIDEMQNKFRISPDSANPRLMALTSLSHQLAKKFVIEDCSTTVDGAPVCNRVVNDRCHSFWNSRYLFAGVKISRSEMKGVALDTITAIVENADMTYEHNLCPRGGWICKLSHVTNDRWKRFVVAGDYSLSKFYYEPENVRIMKTWSPKGESILFSPL